MVFSGKIYDQVKEKLDKYLFGFDRDQLNVSLLAGKCAYFDASTLILIIYFSQAPSSSRV